MDLTGRGGLRSTLTDALNLFLFRPDLNLGATIRALQAKNLLQILAEPNLLTINGKSASFLAGGEFPFPMVQPGAGGTAWSRFNGGNSASAPTLRRPSRRGAPSG